MTTITATSVADAKREVACVDVTERRRRIASYLAEGRVVVLTPPGEGALLEAWEARELAKNLTDHAEKLERNRGGRQVIPFRELHSTR